MDFIKANKERMKKLKETNPDIFSSNKNTIWMNDGVKSKRVSIEDITKFENIGFQKGRI